MKATLQTTHKLTGERVELLGGNSRMGLLWAARRRVQEIGRTCWVLVDGKPWAEVALINRRPVVYFGGVPHEWDGAKLRRVQPYTMG
jgi:hypothetical protein